MAYHIIKIAVPLSTLIECIISDTGEEECADITHHRIILMLISDCVYAVLLYLYMIWTIARLICYSWRFSRLEARSHMFYFVVNSIGLLLSFPLVIDGLYVFINHYDEYTLIRWVYYEDFVAKSMPSLIYLLTKKNEDCFNCFNRLAPQVYSDLQYTATELREKAAEKLEKEVISFEQEGRM